MKKCFFILFYLCAFPISAQELFIDSIINPLQKDQLLFEKVFIHTNKPSYFNDDIIWFKAYVGKNSNKPSLNTTLLYVNLLDENEKVLFSNNILIHKGVGQGQFQLDGITDSSVVYLQAYTNYMQNFGDGNHYLQKIKIINNVVASEIVQVDNYDIQVFPEGGYLLEGAENILGIKSLISGSGVEFSGEIVDSKNNNVASFKNEYLGMTKCSFFYKSDEEYSIILKLNDTIIKNKIPKARKKGLIVKLDNSNNEYLSLDLKTNNKTLKESKRNNFKLLFHQRNQVVDFLEITNLDSLNFHLEIDKSAFFNGVNTLTVFNDNQPISERKFFIEKVTNESLLEIRKEAVKSDSIEYKIKFSDNLQKPLNANLSVSVSSTNISISETTNIKSAFLLSPYVKGTIDNPTNYFNKQNKNRKQQFELLLLTQGWTQYSSKKMITNLNPRALYNFEQGFKFLGTTTPLLSNYLGLMTKDNILIDKIFLNGKTNFGFDKLLVYKGDSVKISFLDNQNAALKPKQITIDSLKQIEFPKLDISDEYVAKIKKTTVNNDFIENLESDITKLDVVDLKGKKRGEKYKERRNFIIKYKDLIWDIGKYYNLELDEKYTSESDLMHYLNREENVKIENWRGLENYLSIPGGEAILFIDGQRINSNDLYGAYVKMEDIESIAVQTEFRLRIYQVFTTDNYKNNIQELFSNFVVQRGYNKVKKYYTPIYNYKSNVKLTEIDWKPELITNELGEVYFKIKKNTDVDNYLFSINGFSESGILINNIISISSKNIN